MQMDNDAKMNKIAAYMDNASKNSLPKDAYLQVCHSCNAKCVMCSIWKNPLLGDTGRLHRIIDRLYALGFEWITFWGGEPLLHPDIDEMLQHAKSKGLNIQIITNGSLIKEHINSITGYVDNLVVSIDSGIPEIHDKIRNKKGIFEDAVEGIKAVIQSHIHPNIEIDCTILNENAETLESIIHLSYSLGKIFVDFDPAQINGVGNNSDYRIYAIASSLEKAQHLAKQYGIEITTDEKISLIKKYLLKEKIIEPCYSYCKDLLIAPNGNVYTCWTIDKIIGNILEDDFSGKWHSELSQNKGALTGHMDACYSCGFSHSRMPDEGYRDIVKKANDLRFSMISDASGS